MRRSALAGLRPRHSSVRQLLSLLLHRHPATPKWLPGSVHKSQKGRQQHSDKHVTPGGELLSSSTTTFFSHQHQHQHHPRQHQPTSSSMSGNKPCSASIAPGSLRVTAAAPAPPPPKGSASGNNTNAPHSSSSSQWRVQHTHALATIARPRARISEARRSGAKRLQCRASATAPSPRVGPSAASSAAKCERSQS